jgi:hypothetical protein
MFLKTTMKEYHSMVKMLENTKIASLLRYLVDFSDLETSSRTMTV